MIDIVVPVFNEAENIVKLFKEIDKEISEKKKVTIVYDFDGDTTVPVVKQYADKFPFGIKLLKNEIGRGVLNAIITGLNAATGDKVLVMMADLSDRLDVVDIMAAKIDEGYDVVCGSRYVKGGKQIGGPKVKGFLSRMAGISLHVLTGIPTHDVTNSFKMYRLKLLRNISIESTGGFEIGLEITVKAYLSGYKIAEVPSEWTDRTEGKSNFHMWKWMPKYLKWYFYCIFNTWGKRIGKI